MKCPHCYGAVSSHMLQCPQCGWTLQTAPPVPVDEPIAPISTVPLSGGQKTLLLAEGLVPVVIAAGMLLFARTRSFGGLLDFLRSKHSSLPSIFVFVMALGVLLLVFQAIASLRDRISGTANVQVVQLLNKHYKVDRDDSRRTRYRLAKFYGDFDTLGRMRFYQRADYESAVVGDHYCLTYSPRIKRVWAIQAKEQVLKRRKLKKSR